MIPLSLLPSLVGPLGLYFGPVLRDDVDGEPMATLEISTPSPLDGRSAPPSRGGETWWERERALGELLTSRGAAESIAVELVSTDEILSKRRGGLAPGDESAYRGNLDLTFTFDLAELGFPEDAVLFVYAQRGHGSGLTDEHVGDLQTVSNIDADEFSQVSEVWYEQRFADGALRVKLGKQDANVDFVAVDHGADFMNSSFGLIPTVPAPTFPDPALGLAASADLAGWCSIGGGIYDGDADGGTSGFDSAFDGVGGTFSVLEFAFRPAVESDYGGTHRFGVWHHSGETEVVGLPARAGPRFEEENHGFYVAIDQPLFRKRYAEEEGLGLFAQFGTAPDDRNELARYVGAGLVYTGLFEERDGDVLGLGIARAELSDRITDLEGRTSETVFELFYKARVLPWLAVQTDLQFVGNPGGDGEDALVVGLRLETVL